MKTVIEFISSIPWWGWAIILGADLLMGRITGQRSKILTAFGAFLKMRGKK